MATILPISSITMGISDVHSQPLLLILPLLLRSCLSICVYWTKHTVALNAAELFCLVLNIRSSVHFILSNYPLSCILPLLYGYFFSHRIRWMDAEKTCPKRGIFVSWLLLFSEQLNKNTNTKLREWITNWEWRGKQERNNRNDTKKESKCFFFFYSFNWEESVLFSVYFSYEIFHFKAIATLTTNENTRRKN